VKSWADYGISEISAESGVSCEEAQRHFQEFDFNKQEGSKSPTFWIATVKEGKYIQDHSLTFEERTQELEKAIAAQERKMRNFIDTWAEKGCTFDFAENIYVTQLREHIASVHQKTMFQRLPEIIKALTVEKKALEERLKNDEVVLRKMSGGDSPSMELLSLMSSYEKIFNEQWMGEQLPTRELSKAQIEDIQSKHFNMTATEFAQQLGASWRAEGPAEFQDAGFDRRLQEVASMLRYDSADQLLTYSSHFWLHLTNIYMLLVRSVKDLLEPRDLTKRSNIGNVGRTGADDCNAAVIEAKHAFRKGGSERGLKLMQYGVKFVLEKHMETAHDIFVELPSVQAYMKDADLVFEIRQAQKAFVEEYSENFMIEYQKFLYMVTTNIQQGKVVKMLNTMAVEKEEKGEAAMVQNLKIETCSDIPKAESRNDANFPNCKCKNHKDSLVCGTQQILDAQGNPMRKFNVTQMKENPACKYSSPYCSADADKHQLSDLAMLLNPRPENCSTLYDELVDSSIDILVNNVGSLMYYLAYDNPDAAIVKRDGFAYKLFEKIRGDSQVADETLQARYPTLGQRKLLAESVLKSKHDMADIDRAITFFQRAYSSRGMQ
jgi:hypothetical protein